MRRLMVDAVSDGSQLVAIPNSDSYTMKIPEAASFNVGKTGLVAIGKDIFSYQKFTVEIERSGKYLNVDDEYYGARFRLLPTQLVDASGTAEMDGTLNYMGEEYPYTPHFLQMLEYFNNTDTIRSPKMIELKQWGNAASTYGYIGLGVYITNNIGTTTATLHVVRMKRMGPHASTSNYIWSAVTHNISSWASTVSTCDIVEMENGTIILVIYETNGMWKVYHSYDCGTTWTLVKYPNADGSGDTGRHNYTLKRIGNRLVIVLGYKGGGKNEIGRIYSDDFGFTWSTYLVIYTSANVPTAEVLVDLLQGQDNALYTAFISNDGGADEVRLSKSLDGATWSTAYDPAWSMDSVSFLQQNYGHWLMHGTLAGLVYVRRTTLLDPTTTWVTGTFTTNKHLTPQGNDTDGLGMVEICSRTFENSEFTDIFVVSLDTHSGSNIYSLYVLRTSMWTGLQPGENAAANRNYNHSWIPNAYPSTADAHPNMNRWTRAVSGASTATLSTTDHGKLTLQGGVGAGSYIDYIKNVAGGLSTTTYSVGLMVQFVHYVYRGYAFIEFVTCSAASNAECNFIIYFSKTQIIVVDVIANAIAATFTPTNWNPGDFQEYCVVTLGNSVYIYRSPHNFSEYFEMRPVELVGSVTGLSTNVFAANNDRVVWGTGSINALINGANSNSMWREVYISAGFGYTTYPIDFTRDTIGKRCHYNPGGAYQGISCQFDGDYAVDGDTWVLETGALYEPENIFISSPSIKWMEPLPTAASPNSTFDWRSTDVNAAAKMKFFNSLAIFGSNCPYFKLWTTDWDGTNPVSKFDCSTGGSNYGPKKFVGLRVSAIGGNLLTVIAGSSAWTGSFVEHQFASRNGKNYYIVFTTGTAVGRCYKILDNDRTQLLISVNPWADGVRVNDYFTLYTDRFFQYLTAGNTYGMRVRLQVYTNAALYPDPIEKQFSVGTVLIGRVMSIDDEWDSAIKTIPNIQTIEGRNRFEIVRELAAEKRIIDLSYTGQTDSGMGVAAISKFYEFARWGVNPVVWLDDDSESAFARHTDPILARIKGPIDQRRVAYNRIVSDGVTWKRNVLDLSNIQLEEVL